MRKLLLAGIFVFLFFSPARPAVLPAPSMNALSFVNYSKPAINIPVVKKKKLNFLQHFLYKMISKKVKKMMLKKVDIDADKMAKQANLFGWISLGALFIFPLASIPFGIMAIVNGSRALKGGTSFPKKAKTGRTLGIISLALVLIAIAALIVILAGFIIS